ncbi:Serine/threonine-protein kinase toxin HipA [Cupriavidus laharis]|uniref:Serine/threonine-protein kinase toxin HipA n=1 Tax=Cupriavidus laharis TaxID=151654 RepID=A0ABM8WT87_9BURK|nr:type II toxin-antitoxin system HipA family toxin [Cupriavidus laharis]CAG9170697.1 Serine/threonine-protein kinase toxin HipA [Cupriavidus laharis]
MAVRRTRTPVLSVWANGLRVGTWRNPGSAAMEFEYDTAWMNSDAGRPLSLSLDYALGTRKIIRGEAVRHYFDNLLPDSEPIRRRLAMRFGTGSTDAFALLSAIGRDCVGAVQLLGEDEIPVGHDRIEGEPLSDAQIEQWLRDAVSAPAPGHGQDDDFRISIAGAQEKTALLRHEGQWLRPHGATPTTHILKLPLGLVGNRRADLSASVENEWLCLNILGAYGLPVAHSEMLTFGGQKVLSVSRFDRQMHASGNWLLRLPQEDFCQVFGLSSLQKYEVDGGPGMVQIATVLRNSESAMQDLETLFSAQLLFWLLAAPDGHAKNFSIRLLAGGRYRMTPLYDVMSVWPVIGDGPNQFSWHRAELAMAVAGKSRHYALRDIQRRHFNAMASRCFLGANAEQVIGRIIARTPAVIDTVGAMLPAGFPQRVADTILNGLRASAERLAGMQP